MIDKLKTANAEFSKIKNFKNLYISYRTPLSDNGNSY